MALSDRLKKLFQLAEAPAPTPGLEPTQAAISTPVAQSPETPPAPVAPAIGLAQEFAPAYDALYDAYRRARGVLLAVHDAAQDPAEHRAREQASTGACSRLRQYCELHGADPALLDTIITDVDQAWLLNDLCVAQIRLMESILCAGPTPPVLRQAASRSQARLQDFCVASGRDLEGLMKKVEEREREAYAGFAK